MSLDEQLRTECTQDYINHCMIEPLMKTGADPYYIPLDSYYMTTPRMINEYHCGERCIIYTDEPSHFETLFIANREAIKIMLNNGANINHININRLSLISLALLENGNFEWINYLINKGADLSLVGRFNETILYTLCGSSIDLPLRPIRHKLIDLFISKGAIDAVCDTREFNGTACQMMSLYKPQFSIRTQADTHMSLEEQLKCFEVLFKYGYCKNIFEYISDRPNIVELYIKTACISKPCFETFPLHNDEMLWILINRYRYNIYSIGRIFKYINEKDAILITNIYYYRKAINRELMYHFEFAHNSIESKKAEDRFNNNLLIL